MEEVNKVNFLCPTSPSSQTSPSQPNFVINPIIIPLTQENGLTNFSLSPRQVSITQIYSSRKIKHPSFRKRSTSGTMPYYIPFRHRQRTKSESADASGLTPADCGQSSMDCENINDKNLVVMDMDAPLLHVSSNPQFNKIKISQLKKSKSMESLLPPKPDENESKVNSSSSTLEFVSHRIQKLKFNE